MNSADSAEIRDCFSAATGGFLDLVSAVGPGDWDRPGLGQWTVRDLVGHTSRSLTTIETYLARPAATVTIGDPLDYLLALRGPYVQSDEVAQRGRDAGAALGEDPLAAVRQLAGRVTALVAATADDATLTTIFGSGATLAAYLPTRTFELTVHTLDLAAALDLDPPAILAGPVAACLGLAAAMAAEGADAWVVLLALTGRRALPPDFSVV